MTCPHCGEECVLLDEGEMAECPDCGWTHPLDPFASEGCLFDSLDDD